MLESIVEKIMDIGNNLKYSMLKVLTILGVLTGVYAIITFCITVSDLLVKEENQGFGFSYLNEVILYLFHIDFGFIAAFCSVSLLFLSYFLKDRV